MRISKSDMLREQAVNLGLCEEWQNEWIGKLKDNELIARYKKGIDFSIQHDWPSVDYIKQNFKSVDLQKNGIYCDEHVVDAPLPKDGVMVFLGYCTGRIEIGGYDVATIYVRHKCSLDIRVKRFARVRICLYDKARVSVIGGSASDTYVYRYGKDCFVNPLQKVVIRNSEKQID